LQKHEQQFDIKKFFQHMKAIFEIAILSL